MKNIKIIYHWIVGMSVNIICDILFLIGGIFSSYIRRLYISKFYLPMKPESEEQTNEK